MPSTPSLSSPFLISSYATHVEPAISKLSKNQRGAIHKRIGRTRLNIKTDVIWARFRHLTTRRKFSVLIIARLRIALHPIFRGALNDNWNCRQSQKATQFPTEHLPLVVRDLGPSKVDFFRFVYHRRWEAIDICEDIRIIRKKTKDNIVGSILQHYKSSFVLLDTSSANSQLRCYIKYFKRTSSEAA